MLICGLLGASRPLAAQVPAQLIEEQAIALSDLSAVNDTVYKTIRGYKVIMLGSIHGTQEAPRLYLGMIRSLLKNGKKVVAGVELPSDGLDLKSSFTLDKLKHMPAFTTHNKDGRQSVAWAEMLIELQKLGVEIVPFDLNSHHRRDVRSHRDSLMFVTLNDAMKKDTSRVLVTLSTNVRNMLVLHQKHKTMGLHLKSDAGSVLKGKSFLSLNHLYNDGEAYYWKNHGFKRWHVTGNAGYYGYAAPHDNYLFVYPVGEGYTGIIFTKTLTPSPPLKGAH